MRWIRKLICDLAEGGIVHNFGGTNLMIAYSGSVCHNVNLLSAMPGNFDLLISPAANRAQLVVHRREQIVSGVGVAFLDALQDERDVLHGRQYSWPVNWLPYS